MDITYWLYIIFAVSLFALIIDVIIVHEKKAAKLKQTERDVEEMKKKLADKEKGKPKDVTPKKDEEEKYPWEE